MARQPIHEDTIPLRKSSFDKIAIKAGIDRGSTLTKIAFVPKDARAHEDTIHLRCLTFHNDHFVDALHVMKEQAELPDTGDLHITGVGAATYRHKIKEVVGLDVVFINEMITIGFGPFVLISNTNPQDIFHPIPEYNKLEGIEFKGFFKDMSTGTKENRDEPFPALIFYMGSGCAVMSVTKDGKTSMQAASGVSGKPFIGMAHALLGTADYGEIMALAEKGNPTMADSTMADIVKGDPESPYGRFPPDMPGFPFGRAAEPSWDRSLCRREDLAASLLGMATFGIALALLPVVQDTGITKIYVAGNFFRSETARKSLYEKISLYLQDCGVQVLILKSGHQGAIGAMLADVDTEAHRKMIT